MQYNFFGIVQNKTTGEKITYQAPCRMEPVEFFITLDNWGYRVLEAQITEGKFVAVYGVATVLP